MINTGEIKSIRFGVLSSEEIQRNAVCQVTNSNLSGHESVYDERMGVIENGKICQSCGLTNKFCPGHYGCIKLTRPIFHPMYYRYIVSFLNMFCSQCSRLVVSSDHLKIERIPHRLERVQEYVSGVSACYFCQSPRTVYSFVSSENTIVRTKSGAKIPITPDECLAIFSCIIDSDIKTIGLSPSIIHPKNLVMEYIVVLPIKSRPYIISDGSVCDDDLTVVYQNIVKINNKIAESENDDKIASLIFHVSTLMNNSEGKSKHNNGGRPIKGIKERISGKDGIIRNNMSGKRVNQSARTVIGPDPTLCTDQVAIPVEIAQRLSVPEHVNSINISHMQAIVDSGRANFVIRGKNKINLSYACTTQATEVLLTDVVYRNGKVVTAPYFEGDVVTRDGQTFNYIPASKRRYLIQVGDTVERHLCDDDIVLINRQPTLHKCSMLAKRVVVRPGKTMRLNLATTKVFNADFDGDEMNIHVPQDYIARTELRELASSPRNVISTQSSKPNFAVVQDGMLGAYLMTKHDYVLPRHIFMDICLSLKSYTQEHYNNVLCKMPMCGRALMSLIIPDDFTYIGGGVEIRRGLFLAGMLTKSVLGNIVHTMYKDYGHVLGFIDEIQFIANGWLAHFGFSIGLGDCLPPTNLTENIEREVARCFAEAARAATTITNPKISNAKVNMALAKAKDAGMKAAKDSLSPDNGFVATVTSGSKGDYFNVCQITGVLGQQNVSGKRIQAVLNNGLRTLPHFPLKKQVDNFGANGFVQNSFIRGLKPHEFFFHAMSGREGVSDTALKTSVSGYTQRKMVKILEDVQVKYDGTVRNSTGEIIQWEYGNDGFDRTQTLPRDGFTDFCDIVRLADRLNERVKN